MLRRYSTVHRRCRILFMASLSLSLLGGGYNYPHSLSFRQWTTGVGRDFGPVSPRKPPPSRRSQPAHSPPSPVIVCDFFSSESVHRGGEGILCRE